MSDTNFPEKGQFFGVVFADGTDRSYRDDVWECIASDEFRIVAKRITLSWLDGAVTFYRADWIVQPVSDAIVAAVQVDAEMRAAKQAA
jgi:hypothetical protein